MIPEGWTPPGGHNGGMSNLPLVRDRADAKIAGVCAALARSWQVDPLIVRVGMVILAILTNGFILAAYAALWALLPERGSSTEPVRRLLPFTRSWSTGALVAVVVATACVLGAIATGAGPGAFVVILVAWLILRFGLTRRPSAPAPVVGRPPLPAPRTEFERLAQAWQRRLDNVDAGFPADWAPELVEAPAPAPALPHAGPRPPAARRRGLRTWLGILVALGVVWTGLTLAQASGVGVPAVAWSAATLGVLGLSLLAVVRPARAAWGRPPALLLATVVALVSTLALLLPVPRLGRTLVTAPTGAAPAAGAHVLSAGEHTVDLSRTAVTETRTVSYRLDLGELTFVPPAAGNVVVRARADLGGITMPARQSEGFDASADWERIVDPAAPTLTVDITVGVGQVVVRP